MEGLNILLQKTSLSREFRPEAMTQMLESAKKKAKEERSLPRIAMKYIPPMLMTMEMLHQREERKKRETGGTYNIEQTFLGNEIYYSSKPLRSLKPILLRDMHIRQRHEGSYLLCRTICPPTIFVSVTLAVEDAEGWCQSVSIYNFPGTHNASISELDTIFPSNTVIAIREPYCKMALAANHSLIRIDSPSDLVILEPEDPLLVNIRWSTGNRQLPVSSQSGAEWKAIGDKHFKAQQYFAALVAYSHALRRTTASVPLRLNRSLTHLRLGNFAAARRDAQIALENQDINQDERIKALYRSAQAEYGEGHYEDAKNLYLKCLEISPDLKDPQLGYSNCDRRLKEHSEGIYDWMNLFKNSTSEPSGVDVAEFVGPIEIVKMKNRGGGRGVRATRDIKPGEILVVAKPFSASHSKDFKTPQMFLAFNFITDSVNDEVRYMVHQKAIFRVAYQPSALDLYKLYGGEKVDPITEYNNPILLESPLQFATDIDVGRIHSICSLNQFGFRKASQEVEYKREAAKSAGSDSTALYLLPSYFNHSCISNASRDHFGEVMVIRALKNIKQGDEVTMAYHGHGAPFDERNKRLKSWIQECDCNLCQQDRNSAQQRRQRKAIMEEMSRPDTSTNRMRDLVKRLDSLYPVNYGLYRVEAYECHHTLAIRLQETAFQLTTPIQSLCQEAIQHEIAAIESLEIQVIDRKLAKSPKSKAGSLPISTEVLPRDYWGGTVTCLAIAGNFLKLNIEWRAERWVAAAIWIHNAKFGGGIPFFKLRYGKVLSTMYGPMVQDLLERIEGKNYAF